MTGELCDCFASKREGVFHILDAVERIAENRPIRVWCCDGVFRDLAAARAAQTLLIAASNWLALASWAGRLVAEGPALLVDVGSTTTDVIPFLDGKPVSLGRTDTERLRTSELVYTGVRRTPVFALFPRDAATEWFATMLDVYLVLGEIAENPTDCDTADGRPATYECAFRRLARVFCEEPETTPAQDLFVIADEARRRQVHHLVRSLQRVNKTLPSPATSIVLAGSGEFLARAAVERAFPSSTCRLLSIAAEMGVDVSTAACAYAVAVLADERPLA
jgi:probable H4MPT-linked C1 transfer pathway protein